MTSRTQVICGGPLRGVGGAVRGPHRHHWGTYPPATDFLDGFDQVATAGLRRLEADTANGWSAEGAYLPLMGTAGDTGTRIRVQKHKWALPGGKEPRPAAEWDAQVLGTDEFGTWLFCAEGEVHRKSDGQSLVVPSDGVQLLPASGWWAAWWWRNEHWIGVDICTPPALDSTGWSYVDLELDLARLADGTVLLVDEDEFEQAITECLLSPDVISVARAEAATLQGRLADAAEPVVAAGWRWLEAR